MEDIINQVDGRVQVIFERTGENGTFRDALWFTQAAYELLTSEDIAAMQQARYDNWIAIVTAPPAVE